MPKKNFEESRPYESQEPQAPRETGLIEIYNPLTRLNYVRSGGDWLNKNRLPVQPEPITAPEQAAPSAPPDPSDSSDS